MDAQSEARLERSIVNLEKTIQDVLVRRDVYERDQVTHSQAVLNLEKLIHRVEKELQDDLKRVEINQEKLEQQRRQDRMLMFSSLVAPIILLLLQVYLWSNGVSP